jgi:hypothetical protein
VARTGQTKKARRCVMVKCFETSQLPRPRNRWKSTSIGMDLTHISGEDGRSMALDQNLMKWQTLAVLFEIRSAFENATVSVS